ncbi:PVC-type heme-binding CxxCH protein [Rhodopirellula sp. P2]|uniref:PVC-type heme-binding CxxCH protein n=1 Tax=Rhodopirellula sp. P2 TaxID=2127060 RepID=UPI002367BAB7|nr:PVC-type heme-binding CxxCH protein [Rhodopirellula sp. P2]WDQ15610.1 GDSL-type esterase/lipase family protein [Rhodopirellula sp. P2]
MTVPRTLFATVAMLFVCSSASLSVAQTPALELQPGDHVCLIGNALGERMQHENHFETQLHAVRPELDLTVRNLCVPGDEPKIRLRSLDFRSPDDHLTHSAADVVLMFFGYNESYRLAAGLDDKKVLRDFADELDEVIRHTQSQVYNGKTSPRIAVISPIAFEETGDRNLPKAEPRNRALSKITRTMRAVADERGVTFVNLFTPTKELFEQDARRLTLDGAHLNSNGYAALAPILVRGLLGEVEVPEQANPELLAAVADKNFHWFNRYRAVNGFSIYGKRGTAGSDGTYNNRSVMNRELEILDHMTANRDARLWAIADGKAITAPIDDSNTLPFIIPKTNVGGPNDPNAKRGKLGSLEYLTTDEQLKTFSLPDGYEIQLVASEQQFPELANPVALDFDAQGRLWVSTMPSYPHWQPKSPMDDKLLILEDTDGDGTADECKTFAGGLHQPTGFEIGRGGVYVGGQHDIYFLEDTDGDDVADKRTRAIIGFDTADSHHGLAAFDFGPGGQLYAQEGTFKFTQIESPYGLTRNLEGGVFRYDPTTQKFGVHVNFAFANPWGFAFNEWGQDFIGDASPGKSYWATGISTRLDYPLKHPGGSQHRRVAGEQGYDDGLVDYQTFYPKRIRPLAGCRFLSSEHFPDDLQGNFLVTNVIGDRAVLRHKVVEKDSGYEGTEEPMLVGGGDGNFRPVDIEIAPDGSLYIIDWHNALIGHLQHNLRDPSRDHSHGRIWRLTHKDRPLVNLPVIAETSTEDLIDQLCSAVGRKNQRHAYRVRRELHARPTDEVLSAAKAKQDACLATADDDHDLLELLWLHQAHNQVNEELLTELLNSDNHRARSAATRVLSYWADRIDDSPQRYETLVADEHPRVRIEALRGISYAVGEPWALDDQDRLIRAALRVMEMPMDHYLEYALEETMQRFEQVIASRAPYLPKTAAPSGDHADSHPGHNHAAHIGPMAAYAVAGVHLLTDPGATFDGHGHKVAPYTAALPVFFDFPAEIVSYQIERLSTPALLAVPRDSSDPKFVPLHAAILARGEVQDQDRRAALDALVALQDSDPGDVLLGVIENLDWKNNDKRAVTRKAARGLSNMLLKLPAGNLEALRDRFTTAAKKGDAAIAPVALAGLIAAGDDVQSFDLAKRSDAARVNWLTGVAMLPARLDRESQRGRVVELLTTSEKKEVVAAAIRTLAVVPGDWNDTFEKVGNLACNGFRDDGIATLLTIPQNAYQPETSLKLARHLVNFAERTPPKNRTSVSFIDAMQVADRAIAKLPRQAAKQFRDRLREITVRLVRIKTVDEEMRYDVPYFAVEAGRPVQVVLENHDGMPHNLVFTVPGALKEVANLGLQAGPRGGFQGKQYVPESDLVLHSTDLVASNEKEPLTFTAPTEPGEYPYVCTFPQHWYRMYGVMVVVEDLDAYNANPFEPADPIGNNRSFIKAWTIEDFAGDKLTEGLRGRTAEIGQKIFEQATCASCHQVAGKGGQIGPALDEVVTKWKGDSREVLTEILHPSDRIDDKYAMHLVLTADGQTFSGLLVEETDDVVKLLANAEAKEPTVIEQDEIEQMVKTSTSMMPKALLDQYTEDEIFELLNYILSHQR